MTTKISSLVRAFHSDEEGLESLQVVMIIAIAAMIMLAAATVGKSGVDWMNTQSSNVIHTELDDFAGDAGVNPDDIEIEE